MNNRPDLQNIEDVTDGAPEEFKQGPVEEQFVRGTLTFNQALLRIIETTNQHLSRIRQELSRNADLLEKVYYNGLETYTKQGDLKTPSIRGAEVRDA